MAADVRSIASVCCCCCCDVLLLTQILPAAVLPSAVTQWAVNWSVLELQTNLRENYAKFCNHREGP